MSETYTVSATDGAARAGILRTAHGEVPTPAFMPVGTKGTVKTVDPEELRSLGTPILLGNTYHLHFRPGEDLIAELVAFLGLGRRKHLHARERHGRISPMSNRWLLHILSSQRLRV